MAVEGDRGKEAGLYAHEPDQEAREFDVRERNSEIRANDIGIRDVGDNTVYSRLALSEKEHDDWVEEGGSNELHL